MSVLYNGVALPDIESVWTDKTTYPYAYIQKDEGSYGLTLTSTKTQFRINGSFFSDTHPEAFVFQIYLPSDNGWVLYTSGSKEANGYTTNTDLAYSIIWSNHDVVDYDNNSVVYLAASEPVPVDDSKLTLFETTITWNGDTTGLPNFSVEGFGTFYKVSDKVFTVEELTGATYDGGGNLADYTGMATVVGESDGLGLVGNGNTGAAVALSAQAGSYEDGFVVLPEDGTYVFYISGDGVAGWLSALYLPNAFGGSITSTTATVNFFCKDLLYTDSVYRIKAWVYKPTGWSYGGVSLPDINTVWTDKETYPYAYLTRVNVSEGDEVMDGCYLTLSNTQAYVDTTAWEDGLWMVPAGSGVAQYWVGINDSAYELQFSSDNTEVFTALGYPASVTEGFSCIWASVDICGKSDSTVWLAASEPTPGGLDFTLPPTYTSAATFAGPTHSEDVTFIGLTPATDYAVYGVIWSETDAATGGNATATFTTLAGDTGGALHLITDRTKADVYRLEALMAKGWDKLTEAEQHEYLDISHKGAYNASDLNRVGAALNYVAELLTEWGYPYYPDMRTNWTAADYFYAADLREYLAAVEGLRERLAVFDDTPNTPDRVRSHQQANDIEKIVEDVHLLLQNMIAELPYADMIYSGAYPF